MKAVDDRELDEGLKLYIRQHMPDVQERDFFKENILPMAVKEFGGAQEPTDEHSWLDDFRVKEEEKKRD